MVLVQLLGQQGRLLPRLEALEEQLSLGSHGHAETNLRGSRSARSLPSGCWAIAGSSPAGGAKTAGQRNRLSLTPDHSCQVPGAPPTRRLRWPLLGVVAIATPGATPVCGCLARLLCSACCTAPRSAPTRPRPPPRAASNEHQSAPAALRSALGSWPPLLGSAPATPVPWSPGFTPNRRPPSSATVAAPPRARPARTRRPGHDRRTAGRPRRSLPHGHRFSGRASRWKQLLVAVDDPHAALDCVWDLDEGRRMMRRGVDRPGT
jgi:hypothetical protein